MNLDSLFGSSASIAFTQHTVLPSPPSHTVGNPNRRFQSSIAGRLPYEKPTHVLGSRLIANHYHAGDFHPLLLAGFYPRFQFDPALFKIGVGDIGRT